MRLLTAKEAHHLADVESPVDEHDGKDGDEDLGAEFDVFASEHVREIQMTRVLVKVSIAFRGGV